MKKVLGFARSMRFGILLLTAIGILCLLATVLKMDAIYHSWYFIALFALLCFNLLLCSVLRFKGVGGIKRALIEKAARSEIRFSVPADKQNEWLRRHHFKAQPDGAYLRCGAGMLGSFVTHVALLLVLIGAVCNFTFAEKQDYSIFVGDSVELTDGTRLRVDSFKTENDSGDTEYESTLSALLPDGSETNAVTRVNYPAKIGRYKVYQQNFANAAVIGVKTGVDEPEEKVTLDEPAFLSLDGETGIYYVQLFGNVIEGEAGVAMTDSSELIHPAYEIQVFDGTTEESGLVFPGTTLEAGGVYYTAYEPQSYPGLRVKSQPEWTLWFLYIAFGLMIVGLYLCFFHVPVSAALQGDAIAVAGAKDINDWAEQIRLETEENLKC